MAPDVLPRLVAAAFLFSAGSFFLHFRRAASRGRMTTFAPPRGDPRRGVVYAFTRGMDPRAKDGVKRHPWVLLVGGLFHAGVFAAAVSALALFAFSSTLTASFWKLSAVVQAAAAVASLALIARRGRSPMLRAISSTDDYVSTALVSAMLVAGAAVTVWSELVPIFGAAVIAVLAYAPFGKIRHCVLFFPVRLQYGRFLGRRGVAPGAGSRPFPSGMTR